MISVCMPLYNGERFIAEQVQSILLQLGSSDELIISDDGSSDASLSVLDSFHDQRVHILKNTERLGPIRNLERALRVACGDLIFLSDQDDVWHPDKVKQCAAALNNYDLVLHDATIIDAEGVQLFSSLFSKRGVKRGFWRNLFRNSYTGCCMAFNRDILRSCIPFPSHITMHDQWIGLVAERKYKVTILSETLIDYRQHGANVTNTVQGSHNSIWIRLFWRINLLRAIFARL